MKRDRLYENDEHFRMVELSGENPASGKHLVVVDVQPEYESAFGNMAYQIAEYINENYDSFSRLTFLYNGADTLGMISEGDYKFWWMKQGLDEDIVYESEFYDKGYAFFRYCIDNHVPDEDVVRFIKFLIEKDINGSREMTEEFWEEWTERYGDDDVKSLMEFSDDAVYIPDLMDELKSYGDIILFGGGINECLKEVEIALDALGKSYRTYSKYTY